MHDQVFLLCIGRPDPCVYRYCYPVCHLISEIKVAVLREEGLNGDREMIAALDMAGFEVWDITMQDLLDKKITLDRFRGIIFPGGFSYAGDSFYSLQ